MTDIDLSKRRPISTAPRDGTIIQVLTDLHGWFPVRWDGPVEGDREQQCWTWFSVAEDNYPPCWTEGICWEYNEDGCQSAQPTHWLPKEEQTDD